MTHTRSLPIFCTISKTTRPKLDGFLGSLLPNHRNAERIVIISSDATSDALTKIEKLASSGPAIEMITPQKQNVPHPIASVEPQSPSGDMKDPHQ